MSIDQRRRIESANVRDEALESLAHMTSWARDGGACPDTASPASTRSRFGTLVDDLALGAGSLYPGWYPETGAMMQSKAPATEIEILPPPSRGIVPAVGRALVRLWHTIKERREQARATVLLSELDDRSLLDIGLTRSDIGRAVRHGRDWSGWQ